MPWKNARQVARSYACNGELVRFYRYQRGLTQVDLAERTGYSDRVIRKAERGDKLHADTIEDLAEALSTDELPIHPEDLVCDPRAVVQRLLDGYVHLGRQVMSQAEPLVAEDIQAIIPGDPELLPFAGDFVGRDALNRYVQLFFGMFQRVGDDFANGQLVVEGKRAVYIARDRVRHRNGGPEWEVPLVWSIELERGQIARIESFFDTHPGVQIAKLYGRAEPGADAI